MSDAEELVALARELVERPSENPPGEERAVATFLADRLRDSPVPFAVELTDVADGRPNVVARAGDGDRTLLLSGHTDVVPADPDAWSGDPYELRRDGDRLVGRGVADMKGAIAAKVLAVERAYRAGELNCEVLLAFVVDEEWDGRGSRALVEGGVAADGAVIGEPTECRVCVAQKGVARYRLTVRGRAAQCGRPDAGRNAAVGGCRLVERVEALDDELREATSHPFLAPETVTLTEFEAGIAGNTVPDRADLTVDWRTHPGTVEPDPYDERIADLAAGVPAGGDSLPVEWERLVWARAAETDPDAALVAALRGAADEERVVGLDAATDARFLVHDAGIPTALYGPGSIRDDAHTADESVAVADLVAAERTYRRLLARF